MTLSRRSFLLSAASTGAVALAAKVALETGAPSNLILGDAAMDEYSALVRKEGDDGLVGQLSPFARVEVWQPEQHRWIPVLQIPIVRGQHTLIHDFAFTMDAERAVAKLGTMTYYEGSVRV